MQHTVNSQDRMEGHFLSPLQLISMLNKSQLTRIIVLSGSFILIVRKRQRKKSHKLQFHFGGLLIELLQSRKMHFQRGQLYPLGSQAVQDRMIVQVVPQDDHQHLLELFAPRCGQNTLHLGGADVVFEVYVEPKQPSVEILLGAFGVQILEGSLDESFVGAQFQDAFEEYPQNIGIDISTLLLAGFSFELLTVFLIFFPFIARGLFLDSGLFWSFYMQEDVCLSPFGELQVYFKIIVDGLECFIHGPLEKIYGKMMDQDFRSIKERWH